MSSGSIQRHRPAAAGGDRRIAVLESALVTFSRFGYRKASLEQVARAARISRPGLYFLFASKEELFRAAVSHALEGDVAEVERILANSDRPIRDRLVDGFGRWAGRYIGPITQDISAVIADNPELLGDIVERWPKRFSELITSAIAEGANKADRELADALAQTMISTSIGLKHQVSSPDEYLARLKVAIDLLLR